MPRAHPTAVSVILVSMFLAVAAAVAWVIGVGSEPGGSPPSPPPHPPAESRAPPALPAPGGPDGDRTAVEPAAASDEDPIALPSSVRGRVVDSLDEAIAGVEVGAVGPDGEDEARARCDPDGSFLVSVPGLPCQISVAEPGWTTLRKGEVREDAPLLPATVVAARAVPVAGVVVDRAGDPILAARLEIVLDPCFLASLPGDAEYGIRGEWHAESADGGAFLFERAPLARGARLRTARRGYQTDERDLDPIPEAPLRIVLDPVLPEGPLIRGTVVFADGSPAAGADVFFGAARTRADAQGAFVLECGWFQAETPLVAARRGRQSAVLARYGASVDPNAVEMPPERLVIPGESLTISGRVVGPAGEGRKGWRVVIQDGTLLDPGGNPREVAETHAGGRVDARTGSGGAFELGGLSDRPYTLLAYGRDRLSRCEIAVRSQAIPAGTKDVVLVAPDGVPGDPIAGRVVTRGGEPVEGATVGLGRPVLPGRAAELGIQGRFRATSDEQGRFEIQGVPAGLAFLVASGDAILPARIVLEPGARRSDLAIIVRERRVLEFDCASASPRPDLIRALDERGESQAIWVLGSSPPRPAGILALQAGRSGKIAVGDDARAIAVHRGCRELGRVAIPPATGETTQLTWP